MAQFPAQFGDFPRQQNARLVLRCEPGFDVGSCRFVRSGMVVQADLLSERRNALLAEGLRSTGVTPLRRYYALLRLLTRPVVGYAFPPPVTPDSPKPAWPDEVSQVPGWSVDARRPLSPRRARPMHALVASRSASGFTPFGRLAALTSVTRPKQVHACALRLTSPSHWASHDRSPRHTPARLHGERAITMISTFQLIRPTRLTDAPKNSKNPLLRRKTSASQSSFVRQFSFCNFQFSIVSSHSSPSASAPIFRPSKGIEKLEQSPPPSKTPRVSVPVPRPFTTSH